jgi:hypothetical protein
MVGGTTSSIVDEIGLLCDDMRNSLCTERVQYADLFSIFLDSGKMSLALKWC